MTLLYLRLLKQEWQAIVTGGILAVLLAVQPYTKWPSPTKWVFWICLILASHVAAFRLWRRTLDELKHYRDTVDSLQSNESARLFIWADWPDHSPANRPTTIYMRNEGRVILPRVAPRQLNLGLYTIEFEPISDLLPDDDRAITYRLLGLQAGADDLLDAVTILKPSEIAPRSFRLVIEATKKNGQVRPVIFSMIYAPLHNPARDPHAVETDRCLTFEPAD